MNDGSITQGARRDEISRARWFRTVLKEYPTGVSIISALDSSGRPQGLVVGTFSAVSTDPPLASFMPVRSSRSYSAIAECERFRVNILGLAHEDLCRSFASADPEHRFEIGQWTAGSHGIPQLDDAVAWVLCRRTETLPAGDHDIVLGEIEDLGLGDGSSGMPMLYFKGGYGSFTMPRLDFDAEYLGSQLRLADSMADDIAKLAESLDALVTLCSLNQDQIVVLAAANLSEAAPNQMGVGVTFPFAAPLGLAFAAWGGPDCESVWRVAGRGRGVTDSALTMRMLLDARQRGYAVSIGPAIADRFDRVVSDPTADAEQVAQLWSDVAREYEELADAPDWAARVSSIQVPIFGADGRSRLALVVSGMGTGMSEDRLEDVAARVRAVAAELSRAIVPRGG